MACTPSSMCAKAPGTHLETIRGLRRVIVLVVIRIHLAVAALGRRAPRLPASPHRLAPGLAPCGPAARCSTARRPAQRQTVKRLTGSCVSVQRAYLVCSGLAAGADWRVCPNPGDPCCRLLLQHTWHWLCSSLRSLWNLSTASPMHAARCSVLLHDHAQSAHDSLPCLLRIGKTSGCRWPARRWLLLALFRGAGRSFRSRRVLLLKGLVSVRGARIRAGALRRAGLCQGVRRGRLCCTPCTGAGRPQLLRCAAWPCQPDRVRTPAAASQPSRQPSLQQALSCRPGPSCCILPLCPVSWGPGLVLDAQL